MDENATQQDILESNNTIHRVLNQLNQESLITDEKAAIQFGV
jgi:hypothetical protein